MTGPSGFGQELLGAAVDFKPWAAGQQFSQSRCGQVAQLFQLFRGLLALGETVAVECAQQGLDPLSVGGRGRPQSLT